MPLRGRLAQSEYVDEGPACTEYLRRQTTGLRRVVTSSRSWFAQISYVVERTACTE